MNDNNLNLVLRISKGLKRALKCRESSIPKLRMRTEEPLEDVTTNTIFYNHYFPRSRMIHTTYKARASSYFNHIQPTFGEMQIMKIMPIDTRNWQSNLMQQGLSASTINKLCIIFGQILDLAEEVGVPNVPQRKKLGMKLLATSNSKDFFLTSEQFLRLRAQCRESKNPNLLHIVDLLVLTGARKREILDAQWQDIDFQRRLLRVPCSKNGKPRYITLCKQAFAIICELYNLKRKSSYLLPNPKTGEPYKCIFHSWDKARKAAGLPSVRIHDLRHSFASALVNSGVSIYEVQQLLGHASIKTTQRYAHLDQTRLQRSVESVSAFYK